MQEQKMGDQICPRAYSRFLIALMLQTPTRMRTSSTRNRKLLLVAKMFFVSWIVWM